MVYLLLVLSMAAVLGLIPAYIAKEKGYSFGLWWLYGWMLFIVAIIHAVCLPERYERNERPSSVPYTPTSAGSRADELGKYKKLLDEGAITEEEYQREKRQILGG